MLSVGDFKFQEKSKNKIYEFKEKGKTIIFVSHDIETIKHLCNKVIIINNHRLIYEGNVEKGVEIYERL